MTDSRIATYEHIQTVQKLIMQVVNNLIERALVHDASKLKSPEVEVFDEFTSKLATSTYGSEEYAGFLAAMKPALDHHYSQNRHHPEYFSNGIHGMTIIDLLEMLLDWTAATKRHNDGDIMKSIEFNKKRFGYSNELAQIFINTVKELKLDKSL